MLDFRNHTQNHANKSAKKNTSSRYKGVYWHKARNKWAAMIRYNRKGIYLGLHESEKEAARAYNEKAKEIFGEYARLNEVD